MGLGDIFSSLAQRVATEAVRDVANSALARYANRRKPGDPIPTSVYCGRLVLTLASLMTAAVCSLFAWLALNPTALVNDARDVWLIILGAFGLATFVALWEAFTHRIDWTAATVRFRRLLYDRTVPWSDIVAIEQTTFFPRIRITFADGKHFAISDVMRHSLYFKRLIESQLTPPPPEGKRRERRKRGRRKDAT